MGQWWGQVGPTCEEGIKILCHLPAVVGTQGLTSIVPIAWVSVISIKRL